MPLTIFAQESLRINGIDFVLEKEIGAGQFAKTYQAYSQKYPNIKYALKLSELAYFNFHAPSKPVISQPHTIRTMFHLAFKTKKNGGLNGDQTNQLLFFPFIVTETEEVLRNGVRIQYGVQLMPLALETAFDQIDAIGKNTAISIRTESNDRVHLALKLYSDIMNEIEYLSGKSYVHTDIKPGNIGFSNTQNKYGLIDYDSLYSIKIGDESLPKPIRTPVYAAPELDSSQFNELSSLYSLAVSLLKILDPNFNNSFSQLDAKKYDVRFNQLHINKLKNNLLISSADFDHKKFIEMFMFIESSLNPNPEIRLELLEKITLNTHLQNILQNIQKRSKQNNQLIENLKLKLKKSTLSSSLKCENLF